MKDNNIFIFFITTILLIAFSSCQNQSTGESTKTQTVAEVVKVDSTYLQNVLAELGADKYMGRMPATPAEPLTINYIANEFKKMGVQPGNGDSYFQEVPLATITAAPEELMVVKGGKGNTFLSFKKDVVTSTQRLQEKIEVNDSELVFCGFGIVAPEYDWNDYEGIDMKGKTAVVFVNDPGFYTEDATLFKGKTMTYYGRWTYKFEEAARQGAAGVLIVHETNAAGYPWFVVQSSWTGGLQSLQSPDDGLSRCAFEGWVTRTAAGDLFKNSTIEGKNMVEKALAKDFKPTPMGLTLNHKMEVKADKQLSQNVVGIIPGSETPDEYLIYTAHWDHIGIGPVVNGDSIYNGALDNASGMATFMAIAKAFATAKVPPKRSIVFLAVTAEEQGLLGSQWYAENPIYPLDKTIANLNKDGANVHGSMKDLTITGYGHSDLDELATAEAKKQGRYVLPDQEPEKGYFFRSDHFNFAKVGVPAFYAGGRYDHKVHGKEYAQQKANEYTKANYHQPSDEYSDDWDLTGAVEDAQLYYSLGYKLANEKIYPQWKEGSEFRLARKIKD